MEYLRGNRVLPPVDRRAPLVTVLDGQPCSLAFIGSALGTRAIRLGVDDFGQSGIRGKMHDYYEIGPAGIVRVRAQPWPRPGSERRVVPSGAPLPFSS